MKKPFVVATAALVTLVAGVANAADLPNTKGAPTFAPPPPAFTWTGLYVGAQVGAAWNSGGFDDSADPNIDLQLPLPAVNFHANDIGVIGGGHIGYNYQINNFVIGAEGSFSYVGIDHADVPPGYEGFATITTKQPWLGSIGGRVGYAFDRVLIYATGGAAFTRYYISDADNYVGTEYSSTYGGGHSRAGWTAGAGIEYALTDNWIIGVDYKYYNFGSWNLLSGYVTPPFNGVPAGPGFDVFRLSETENAVTARVSYKFDLFAPPAPVVAKY